MGRTSSPNISALRSIISTHSPRVGRTLTVRARCRGSADFNSLAPCGANPAAHCPLRTARYFNSLAPCGANLESYRLCFFEYGFQLTRPVWGEPYSVAFNRYCLYISTHSPRVGRTTHFYSGSGSAEAFQLTRPVWGEPRTTSRRAVHGWLFQLTRPVWGEPLFLCSKTAGTS